MRLRQIAFAARDLPRASQQLAELFALDAPYRDLGVAAFELDNVVYVFGDQFIEIVSPVQPGTSGGRHIERRGDSGYMLLLQTDDLDRERARFARLGLREVHASEHDDIRAVHLHPKDVGAAIVSVDQPTPAAAWRWGGPLWRLQPSARAAQRIVGVALEARDPHAMARRWAEVFGLGTPQARAGTWRLTLDGGWLDFVGAGTNGEGIAGFTLAVAELDALLQRAARIGLPVSGQAVQLLGARIELQALNGV
jgi:hypothetical protein